MTNSLQSSYCGICLKNVPHRRYIRSASGRWLDRHFGNWARRIRLGPWYCIHCDNCQLFLAAVNADADDYRVVDPGEIDDDHRPHLAARDRGSADAEVVGNFLKTEQSLVHRSHRSERFSTRFRDDLVDRLLQGRLTLNDLRAEHQVSEREVLDWIAGRLQRAEDQAGAMGPQALILPPADDNSPETSA